MLKFGVFTVFFQDQYGPISTDCCQYYFKSVNLLPALLDTAPPTILSTSSSSSANVIYYVLKFFKTIEHKKKLNRDKRSILKGNTDTSGQVSGLVPIRSGDCGAKFKPGYFLVCIKKCIRILSLSFQDIEDFQSG